MDSPPYISLRDFHAAHAPYSDPNFEPYVIPAWNEKEHGPFEEFAAEQSRIAMEREARWRWAFADAMLALRGAA
ncbi:MAG: hypothetical protein CL955_03985 [Erythrobacteraceae bacterium]|nr:hypothetical protein [Erythrobacteraceae bacterium]|tara:strand:+ start:737 stop:958 length:222 start_codon:yes stop_codon:yes gene_type:complete